MKRAGMGSSTVVLLGLALLVVNPAALWCEEEAPKTVTVRGSVEVASIDTEGNTKEVGIWDEDTEDYFVIANTGEGAELFKHVDERVEATGTVGESDDGARILTVTSFTILAESKPAGDTDEEEEQPAPPEDEGNDDEGSDDW